MARKQGALAGGELGGLGFKLDEGLAAQGVFALQGVDVCVGGLLGALGCPQGLTLAGAVLFGVFAGEACGLEFAFMRLQCAFKSAHALLLLTDTLGVALQFGVDFSLFAALGVQTILALL